MIIELEPVFNNDGMELPFNYELSLSQLEVAGACPIKAPVKVTGSVKNNAGIVTLNGNAVLLYEDACDRCAEPVAKEFTYKLEHNLIPELNDENNDSFIVVKDMRLNLDELVEEDVNLSLPSKFLCKDDCKGICPICGKNLNNGPCDCKAPIDPRLEGLLQFLDK